MDNPYIEIEKKLKNAGISDEETFHFIGCCTEYDRSFLLLRHYDEGIENVFSEARAGQDEYVLEVEKANVIIETLKLYLDKRGENVAHFAVVHNGGIEQVIGNIYQTAGQKELYPSLEDKAVQLFYLLVKDHIFVDGNKRIASFLFLWFLDMNDMLVTGKEDSTINYVTIYALAVFVAGSNPKDKDIIVQFIRILIMTYRESFPPMPINPRADS